MWKTHFTVVNKGLVLHRGCGNPCANLRPTVEKRPDTKVFHISTGSKIGRVVEMWKT